MKTIAIILLIAGVLLLAAGIIIFFVTDCRKVFRDLTATRKMQIGGLDDAAQEIYYGSVMAYNNDDEPVIPAVSAKPESAAKQATPAKPAIKMFRRNTPHEAVDDTALLAAAKADKAETAAKAEPAFTENEAKEVAEKRLETVDRTKPLIFQPSQTAPLTGFREIKGFGTEPLRKAGTQPLQPERADGTAPLKQEQSGTQPL